MGRISGNPAWWSRRNVDELCDAITVVAARYGLGPAADMRPAFPKEERVGRDPDEYEIAYLPVDDEPEMCELSRIQVAKRMRRKGLGTCLYFSFEDWLRELGCLGVAGTFEKQSALLAARAGFDFDPPGLPPDLERDLQLPPGGALRYPFEVAGHVAPNVDGARLLLRDGFTGKRVFDADPTLEGIARSRRQARRCL